MILNSCPLHYVVLTAYADRHHRLRQSHQVIASVTVNWNVTLFTGSCKAIPFEKFAVALYKCPQMLL